jgi:hypothetical protein
MRLTRLTRPAQSARRHASSDATPGECMAWQCHQAHHAPAANLQRQATQGHHRVDGPMQVLHLQHGAGRLAYSGKS